MIAASKRRWFRFSLRTMFAVVTMLVILLGSAGLRVERARHDQRVLTDLDAVATVSFRGYDMSASSPESLKTKWVFEHFFSVNRLDIGPVPHMPDDALKHLVSLPRLETLKIESDAITDDGIRHLLGIKRLRVLGIASSQVTDEGLAILAQMKQLEELAIESRQLSAAALEQLKRDLPHCQFKSFETIVTSQ